MSEKYLIEKQYLNNALYRAYIEGNVSATVGGAERYAEEILGDMIRDDKPFEQMFNPAHIQRTGFWKLLKVKLLGRKDVNINEGFKITSYQYKDCDYITDYEILNVSERTDNGNT